MIFIEPTGKTLEQLEAEKRRLSREYKLMTDKKHNNLVEILKSTDKSFTFKDVKALLNIPCLKGKDDVLAMLHFRSFQAQQKQQIPTISIQMELCGKTLRHWLNTNNDTDNPELWPVRRQIVKDMYEGLKYLHSNKIIHRDFRPENIMFSFSPNEKECIFPVKVGDFGLCRKVHSEHTATNTLTPGVGNDTYRALETKFLNYGIPADLYSFGLVSWEVLQRIKNTISMFDRLVNDSETGLIVEADWWLRNWAGIIVLLTKRHVQDRIQKHDKILLIDPSKSEFTAESHTWFIIKEYLVPGDIVNIDIKDKISKAYHFKVNNVTFNGVDPSTRQHLRLDILGNSCTINNLNLEFLSLKGDNFTVNNVTCNQMEVNGDGNRLTGVRILHKGDLGNEVGTGISLRGENNILKSFQCCNINLFEKRKQHNVRKKIGSKPFDKQYDSICVYISKLSKSCVIENANLRNGFIEGAKHGLNNIKCTNAIQINGRDHTMHDVDAVIFIDNSTRSPISVTKL